MVGGMGVALGVLVFALLWVERLSSLGGGMGEGVCVYVVFSQTRARARAYVCSVHQHTEEKKTQHKISQLSLYIT